MTSSISLVFFGTGTVSLDCLEGIGDAFTIEAIITKPDHESPHGKITPPAVKTWGEDHGVPIFQLANKAALTEFFGGHKFDSRLGLVVDYGLIIPQSVLDAFELGLVNSHFSLLPAWRGADPITAAVLAGDEITGVTVQRVVYALDEGPILAQERYKMPKDVTTPLLTEELTKISNRLLIQTLPKYVSGQVKPKPQDPSLTPSFSHKLTKTDGLIDWTKPADQLEREIRAYIGWPGSYTTLGGIDVIITNAHAVPVNHPRSQPGEVEGLSDVGLITVECGQGYLCIERLKPAGKREMSAQEFLVGHPLES